MDVSVIMINYNTFELTSDALNSIFQYTEGLEYEIILIDNASPDRSGERLAEVFGRRIKYIQSGANLGTSKAFNLGVKNSCGKYVLWLNTDVIIKENFIFKLFSYMEGHPECGVCGGNLLDFKGEPAHSFSREILTARTICAVSVTKKLFRALFKKKLSYDHNYSGKPMEVASIIGADMMIRRETLDKVGLFDERIFMYCEESEFQYRVLKYSDYKIVSVPDAVMYHLEGGSFARVDEEALNRRLEVIVKSECIYLNKHFGEREVSGYLRLISRTCGKFIIIAKLMRDEEKRANFTARRRAARKYLNDFENFISAIGGKSE